ncbi:MAG TPA: hypothetical protein VGN14_06190 [Candidatus Elarobacter sp.]
MNDRILATVAAAVLAAAPLAAAAQSAAPMPAPMTMAPAPSSEPTAAPAMTSAPATSATSAPATAAPKSVPAKTATKPAPGQYKKLQSGSLSFTDLRYGITHPTQEVAKVRAMKKVDFNNLRVYRLSTGLKSMLKIGDANAVRELAELAAFSPVVEVAQTNGSNSPIAALQYVLANINVSNALNNVNVLNGANVNVGVTLADVLNGNKISIGQVAGIFVNGLGVITTITK